MTIKFFDLKLHDEQPPLLTEDSFRAFAGVADIQEVTFDSLYKPTSTGWTLDAGMTIKVIPVAGRWDDGASIWDDGVTEWLAGFPDSDPSSSAYWDDQLSTWGDGVSRWT